jgi:hypothetical protein
MDDPILWTLHSKRFWTGILAVPVGYLLAQVPALMSIATSVCTTYQGLAQGSSCDPSVVVSMTVAAIAYLIVWYVGMKYGNAKLTLSKSKATVEGVFKRVPIELGNVPSGDGQ